VPHPAQVEQAVEEHLRLWEAYARRRQADEDTGPLLPAVRSWERGVDFDWRPSHALPLVIVTVASLPDPTRTPDGWTARVPIGLSVTCEDDHQARAADQAKRLLAALRQVLLARPSAALVERLAWLGDDFVPLEDRNGRRVSSADAAFEGTLALPAAWTLPSVPPDPYVPPTSGVPITSTDMDTEPRLP
jgi:acyl transferase domain-containing protein